MCCGALTALGAVAPAVPGGQEDWAQHADIVWDTWGVPHIFADSDTVLASAFGKVQARNHANLLLRLHSEARGRAADYLGPEYLEQDRLVRTLGIPDRGREWLAAQEPKMSMYLALFVGGINSYAATNLHRIDDALEVVLPVTEADVLAHAYRVLQLEFVGHGLRRRPRGLERERQWWGMGRARNLGGFLAALRQHQMPMWNVIYADTDGRFRVLSGDSFVAAVEFSDPVRARVLLSYGNASQPGSPHVGDQLQLLSEQRLRPAWRTRAEVEANRSWGRRATCGSGRTRSEGGGTGFIQRNFRTA